MARVKFHGTPADNSTVRVTVEHPEYYRGVRTFLRYTPETVGESVRSHLQREIDATLSRVEVHDDAGVGLTESDLLGREQQPTQTGGPAAVGVFGP
jgi:hypothetical protein